MELSRWAATSAIQIIETILVLAVCLWGIRASRSRARFAFPSWFAALARHKSLGALLAGVSVLLLRLALVPLLGVPAPEWHDEFSYLLAADTFAHGRLTNPAHPMWKHFETFHVIQYPTYMSMYPPAQGLVLAAGERLSSPWAGQLLMTAALCSALCWMLQGWFPPAWALLGTILAVLRIGILSYWINGYWSASVVAFGGVLLLGAWGRLRHRLQAGNAATFAVGLLVLANSRPYEGLLVSLPFLVALARGMLRLSQQKLGRVALPIVILLLVGFGATGCFYSRVTGNPLRMTYQVNRTQYAMAPYFLWQHLRAVPLYRHPVMRDFYEWEVEQFRAYRSIAGFWRRTADKFWAAWSFYLGPLLTLPLLALPWIVRDRKLRLVLISGGLLLAGVLVSTFFLPHYLAPGTGLLYLVLVQGMRHLSHWRWNERPVGRRLVLALPLIAAGMICVRLVLIAMHSPLEPRWPRGNLERAALQKQLERLPRQQLVLVSYLPSHNPDHEWVYNLADIDSQKVVWARDMGPDNAELLHYYPGRQVWRLNPDRKPVELQRLQ